MLKTYNTTHVFIFFIMTIIIYKNYKKYTVPASYVSQYVWPHISIIHTTCGTCTAYESYMTYIFIQFIKLFIIKRLRVESIQSSKDSMPVHFNSLIH